MKTILLIDDEENDILLMQLVLERIHLPCKLRAVKSVEEGLEYLSGVGPYKDRGAYPLPDLIFLDLKLLGIDGHEALHEIRVNAAFHLTPVIILSDSDREIDMKRAHLLGASSYHLKPKCIEKWKALLSSVTQYWFGFDNLRPA